MAKSSESTYTLMYNRGGFIPLIVLFSFSVFFLFLGFYVPDFRLQVLGYFLLLTGFMSIIAVCARIVSLVVREGVAYEISRYNNEKAIEVSGDGNMDRRVKNYDN